MGPELPGEVDLLGIDGERARNQGNVVEAVGVAESAP
jgi:hypothetical protein